MQEFQLKYWNYRRGEKGLKREWNNSDDFFDWLDEQPEPIKGKFTLRLDGGYSKNRKTGLTVIIDVGGSEKIEIGNAIAAYCVRSIYKEELGGLAQ